MTKLRIALLTIAALAIGYAASAETVTPGTDGTSGDYGPAYLDAATSKLWCSQAPGISVQLPNQSSPVSWPACSTVQIMSSDICTNTAGGCPILDTNSRLPVAQMPPITVVTPTGMVCAGKTDTTTSTSTATSTGTLYQTSAQPVTCTVTATNTSTVTATNWSVVKVNRGGVTAVEDATPANIGALATSTVSGTDVLVDVSGGAIAATHALTSANVTSALTYTPMNATVTHLSGDIGTSTISGTNVTVDVSSGSITATHTLPGAPVVVLPNSTKTLSGTVTVTQTDIGTTAQTAGTIPIRDGTGHIPAVDVPYASGDVVANTAITASGATNKIVQYDAKGLVLSGVDATPANIGADVVGAAAARAAPGTCPGGQYASATTTSGVTCSTPSGSGYTLPAATGSTLGGVKCGSGTTCAGDGTITLAPDPKGTLYLVAGVYTPLGGSPSTAFVTLPAGETQSDPSLTLTAGGSIQNVFYSAQPCDPSYSASGNPCSLVNRPELATDPKWIPSGTITINLWAKATSQVNVLIQPLVMPGYGGSVGYVWISVTSASWTMYSATIPLPSGLLLPANSQLAVFISAMDPASGTPTITIGATSGHYTSINGPWVAGDRSSLSRGNIVQGVPSGTSVTSGIATAYTYGPVLGYTKIDVAANLKNTGGSSTECTLYLYGDSSQLSVNYYTLPAGAEVTAVAGVQDHFSGNSITVRVGALTGGTCTVSAPGGNGGGRLFVTPVNPAVVPE